MASKPPAWVRAAVDGYAHGRAERLHSTLAAMPAAHPGRGAVVALLDRLAGGGTDPAAAIDALLSVGCAQPDVQCCLLDAATGLAVDRYPDLAPRLIDRLQACLPALSLPRTRCMVWRRILQRDSAAFADGTGRTAALGLAAAGDDGDLRLEFLYRLVLIHLTSFALRAAAPYMAELVAGAGRMAAFGFDAARLERWFVLLTRGPSRLVEEAEAALRGPGLDGGGIYTWFPACQLAGRDDLAAALVARAESVAAAGGGPALAAAAALCRYRTAYAQRAYDDARALLRIVAERHGALIPQRYIAVQLLDVALAQGRAEEAAALLEVADPHGTAGTCAMARIRHRLLVGRPGAAAAAYAELAVEGPAVVDYFLFDAHEIDARRFARLAAGAPSGSVAPAPDPGPPPHPRPGPAAALVGSSAAIAAVRTQVARLAGLPQPVLITGETGTGKEIVARMLHEAGPGAGGPFLAINCAGLGDALAESELFGHRKGTFTGALADHPGLCLAAGTGTLFLDEVNSLSPRVQGLLLRLIESGEFHPIGAAAPERCRARIVAATNADLGEASSGGSFRSDLRFRLQRLEIRLPPLRHRPEDIPELCRHFISGLGVRRDLTLAPDLLAAMRAHPWPGNVRELRNLVERMALLAGAGDILALADAPELAAPAGVRPVRTDAGIPPGPGLPGHRAARQRRERILALLAGSPRLYKQDAVIALGAAQNTVSSDLAALEREGLIRRVVTSGNLRTSYWVRTAERGDGAG